MSSRFTRARRAAAGRSNPFVSASRAVTANAGGLGRQAAVILAASGLAFTGSMAANAANAPAQKDAAPASAPTAASQVQAPLSASSSVKIAFERPAVKSTPAPVVQEPVVVAKPAAQRAAAPAPAAAPVAAPAPAPKVSAPKVTVQSAPAPAKAPAAGGVNASMVSAAYAQVGITQDCTAMVEKALGASGIRVGDLAPMQFMNHGKVVSTPQPGDMVVQSGHVGIFVGNGKVLSGGMNGVNETVVHPLSWLTATGPVTFVRAGA
jgi:cell wall-associated NlpC family hydrolase